MISPLYYVSCLVYMIILAIILKHDLIQKSEINKEEKAYLRLLKWVIFFCAQDTIWGICASDRSIPDSILFISSTIFHLSTVFTTFFWLNYILTYLSGLIKHPKRLLLIDGIVVISQVILVCINVFTPVIFSVKNGMYITEKYRSIAFFNQYGVYLLMSLVTAINTVSIRDKRREKYVTVFIFTLAPVFLGAFQLLYPDGPFYSIGYFMGCFIIHIFVVTKERDELAQMQTAKQFAEQVMIANTDELTGLRNRRAYEEDMSSFEVRLDSDAYAYIAIDINGLKNINDTYGHAAGDKLITGTADCLITTLGTYGRVYRIGGDEFAAVVIADEGTLFNLQKSLDEATALWNKTHSAELSFSVGIATKAECSSSSISNIAKLADERMYKSKAAYYARTGIDRRGRQSAYNVLCASYTKVLKINLTTDSFTIINMNIDEKSPEMGYSERLSQWMHDFGTSGRIHKSDLDYYLSNTDIDYLRNYFIQNSRPLHVFYRRKIADSYRRTRMEILPAEDFSDENQSLYLYVKDIDK